MDFRAIHRVQNIGIVHAKCEPIKVLLGPVTIGATRAGYEAMPEIKIVRAIKPKQGMYIAEGSSEYIGKHPYGEGASGFWVGMKIVWRGRFFSSQSGLFVLPDLCAGVSRLSAAQTRTEARWSAFSGGQKGIPIGFGPIAGLLAGAVGSAFTKTNGLSGFAVYYVNEANATGGFLAAAAPEIVDEIFSVVPEDKVISLQGVAPGP